MNPLVSVILTSYNHSNYIVESLNSIKNQTYSNIELIVADDASKDDSIDVFENWLKNNDFNAKKNFHKINTGFATVLNECIELATGHYIKIIAADDYLHPESIEKCVLKLEELGDEYGMVFTDTFAVNDSSEKISDLADYNSLGNIPSTEFRKELIKANRIAALTVLIKSHVLNETGKYDSKFIIEDYYRWLKINKKYFIAYIPEKLAYYRQHSTNISNIKAEKIEQEDISLKIMFDKNGEVKDKINLYILKQYINNKTINQELKKIYNLYPFKVVRLNYAIKYNLPVFLYRILCKII